MSFASDNSFTSGGAAVPLCDCNLRAVKVTSGTDLNPYRWYWTCRNFKNSRRCEFFVWDDHELNDWYKKKVNEAKRNVELLYRECGELKVRLRVADSEVEAKKRALVDAKKNLAMLEASEKEKTELMVYADREIVVLKMKVETLEDKNKKMKKLTAAGNENKNKKKSVWSVRALIVVCCLAFAIAVVKLGM